MRQAVLQEEEAQRLRSLFDSPSIAASDAENTLQQQEIAAVSDNRGNRTHTSFAQIAGGGGYFPSLGETRILRAPAPAPAPAPAASSVAANVWSRGAVPPPAAPSVAASAHVGHKASKKGNSLLTFG